MAYSTYRYDNLKKLCTDIFTKYGYSRQDSLMIADGILAADLYGIESHGIQRLIMYASGIDRGGINPTAQIAVEKETPVSALVNGNHQMGQLVGLQCMRLAIEKAKRSGIGLVEAHNSNHYGIAGYYARMAVREGLLGISMTNTESIVVPTGGRQAMLGTNPIAVGMPAKPVPFLLDMSTSVVTRGKIEVYDKNGERIPSGWAVGNDGKLTTDPRDILTRNGGGLLPLGGAGEELGGHKEYGLALMVELFTAILSGGLTSDSVSFLRKTDGVSHMFMAVDYGMFGDKNAIEAALSCYLNKLKHSPRAEGTQRIYTHGEKENEAYGDRLKNGIPVNSATVRQIEEICRRLGIDCDIYQEN